MNRRSFFNSLSAAVVGCYVAVHFRLADVVKQASIPMRKLAIVNPAWINAPYEEFLILAPGFPRPPWPTRFDANRKVVPIHIEVEVGR